MKNPTISSSAFVADNATVRGDVTLGERSSVFFGAVLRGDRAPITIGSGTNIQDNCVVHVDYDYPVVVGQNVTVGHGAILHGCTVGDNTLIGMGAIVLNGAQVGSNCLIGAGALVPQHAVIDVLAGLLTGAIAYVFVYVIVGRRRDKRLGIK